jgi:hypothetical protein
LKKMSDNKFVPHTVDLADRGDAVLPPPNGIVSRALQLRNAVVFVSEPLKHSQELSGLFSGKLDFTVNKQDLDLTIGMYELLPSGDYVQLYDPVYEIRASYVHDRVTRQLLRAGERQQLTFKSDRLTSRKLEVGSRVVVVLGVIKRPDRQINYGTGGAVNEESVEDGKVPVKIRWYSDSYIELPIHKEGEAEPTPAAPAAAAPGKAAASPAKGDASKQPAPPAKDTAPSGPPLPKEKVAAPPAKAAPRAKSPPPAKEDAPNAQPASKDAAPSAPRQVPNDAGSSAPPKEGDNPEPAPPANDGSPPAPSDQGNSPPKGASARH